MNAHRDGGPGDPGLSALRGLRTDRTAQTIIAGHAFMQNLRRGHYELGIYDRVGTTAAAAAEEAFRHGPHTADVPTL